MGKSKAHDNIVVIDPGKTTGILVAHRVAGDLVFSAWEVTTIRELRERLEPWAGKGTVWVIERPAKSNGVSWQIVGAIRCIASYNENAPEIIFQPAGIAQMKTRKIMDRLNIPGLEPYLRKGPHIGDCVRHLMTYCLKQEGKDR